MKNTQKAPRPSVAIAAAALTGLLLASCSSGTDGEASADTTTGTSTSTSAASPSETSPTGTRPSGTRPNASTGAAIEQASRDYLDAINSGEVARYKASVCTQMSDAVPAGSPDSLPLEQQIVLDQVENILVDGDTATAEVTASLKDTPDEAPQMETITFVNEDGWKFCQ